MAGLVVGGLMMMVLLMMGTVRALGHRNAGHSHEYGNQQEKFFHITFFYLHIE
jgi:hypothetical protein